MSYDKSKKLIKLYSEGFEFKCKTCETTQLKKIKAKMLESNWTIFAQEINFNSAELIFYRAAALSNKEISALNSKTGILS